MGWLSRILDAIKAVGWFLKRKDKRDLVDAERDARNKRDELRDFLGKKGNGN